MLDFNHPQTEHIFAAARLEDAAHTIARRIISAQPSERAALLAQAEQTFESMHTLNSERFGGSSSIASVIGDLRGAFHTLAASASPSWEIVGSAFTRFESDDGFGTVWI